MSRSEIRAARSADLDRILAIESSWETTPHWSRSHFEAELSSGRSSFLVLEEDGAVSGYAVLWKVPPEAQLQTLAVAPEASGRGLGRRLLERLIADSRLAGLRRMTLEVSERNDAARRLYRGAGFRVVGRRAKFYNDGSDAILMDLVLPS